jgi:hypothetical protein
MRLLSRQLIHLAADRLLELDGLDLDLARRHGLLGWLPLLRSSTENTTGGSRPATPLRAEWR